MGWRLITVKSAALSWTRTSLNSAMVAENISVSISAVKGWPVRNPIRTILDITIVKLVWMISFFVEIVANTGQGGDVFPSKTMFVRNVRKYEHE